MQVVSSAQTVQLHNFPDLQPISKYGDGSAKGIADFQFFQNSLLLVTSNPEQPIEYLTKKKRNDAEELQFVRRIRTDIANTVACPKKNGLNIAIGLSSGHIQMHNYKTMEEATKFNAPSLNDGVVAMDFNCQDDFLAGLHESGIVQLFGLNTTVRMASLDFDKEISHIRFHPKKKFHLGMVSYNGAVYLYDTQTMKKIFTSHAHAAPCMDLAMSATAENCLVSVGYDHIINLFDTRTRIKSVQLSSGHPLSAVSISPCGHYCCVGNLKGQLLTYDFRQLDEPLVVTKSAHNSFVKRVEFVPMDDRETRLHDTTLMFETDRGLNQIPVEGRRQSLQRFFDHHQQKQPTEAPKRKLSNIFSQNNISGTRISLGTDLKRILQETYNSSSSDVEFVGSYTREPTSSAEPAKNSNLKSTKPAPMKALFSSKPTSGSTIQMSLLSDCEDHHDAPGITIVADKSATVIENPKYRAKMNTPIKEPALHPVGELPEPTQHQLAKELKQERVSLNQPQTSTPLTVTTARLSHPLSSKKQLLPETDIGDSVEHNGGKAEGGEMSMELPREVEQRINEKMDLLEKKLQFQMENIKWELKNYNMVMYMKQMDALEELQSTVNDLGIGMNCLVQSDEFIKEFFKLRLENEQLKAQLMGSNGH